jgi:hypothetical protein
VHPPSGHLASLAQGVQKEAPVLLVMKDVLTAVATGHDVIEGTGELNAKAA